MSSYSYETEDETDEALAQEKPFENLGAEMTIKQTNPVISVVLAVLFGVIAAILWALIAKYTERNLGIIAILAGFMVSLGFRIGGKNDNSVYGIVGACIAALSILLGNMLTVIFLTADYVEMGVIEVLPYINYAKLPELIIENFSFVDLIFYSIAFKTAYNGSFNKNSELETQEPQYTLKDLK